MADENAAPTAVREGSRWLHAKPTPEEVTGWFSEQPLHDGMDRKRDRYIGGIVVIGATEKIKVTKWKQNGDPYVVEVEQATFTPYVKVDTRVTYFRDLVVLLNGGKLQGDLVGVIEPVEVPVISDPNSGYYNANLKKGLAIHAVRQNENTVTKYLTSTWMCAIYERQSYVERVKGNVAIPILQGEGTKQVPVKRNYPDDSAVMKAETGAIGRALGVAGILVVGTGVASAEDMQEALSQAPPAQAGPEAAALPAEAPAAVRASADATAGGGGEVDLGQQDDETLRARALELRKQLQRVSPDAWKTYVTWYETERNFPPLNELVGTQLVGAVRKLERDLAEASSG